MRCFAGKFLCLLFVAFFWGSYCASECRGNFVPGDKLTVIQRPIHSIPQLTFPGQSFEIRASAPEETTGWQAFLQYQEYSIDLPVTQSVYDETTGWHILTVQTPTPDFYELFDLVVLAGGVEADTAVNAVRIEPETGASWCFIHITDTHLTTHRYSYESGYFNDMTELDDFEAVIDDINIINPKFVLHTGDVVNEGELEDFQNMGYFSAAKNAMQLLNVPIYLVSGSNDIGGWDATPPPDGTARNNWYSFFGWDILKNPNGLYPYRTQNYSFVYNGVKFIGLEAYENYENFQPDVFGDFSFTIPQMNWLITECGTSESSKVLFYHYDFSSQINLEVLGVDGALWGHIHADSGSESARPFNLATAKVCDGGRSYRLIKVQDGALIPQETCQAGSAGQNLTLSYSQPNDGTRYSNTATIVNNLSLDLEHCLVKFLTPASAVEIQTSYGTITQAAIAGAVKTVYVEAFVPASSEVSITLSSNSGSCDVNSDGRTNLPDAILVLRILSGFPQEDAIDLDVDVDVNGDAMLGLEEVLAILGIVSH
ncbi:Calcineurin-like phosphoesterase [Desulfatibacillum alkenivorans DSM 16219]|jgi:hypothetical protein|uniref:Calcineurin-like phosphoesterase n=1 Tax=Desulfatibacillum alkenivorans DSM 16219 TaxID=1121393 RepID=A0A1M6V638_9BACT|nr:metallophosphoesterase [Desulfatibacillum alkenivorans]SHK76927.1 Calcineurin-like phosphoesterase [Desulfatibacillum alkenivorans DSM 16219]